MTFSNSYDGTTDGPQAPRQARLDNNWLAITAELDAPKPSLAQRSLGVLGFSSGTTRLLTGTPALRRAWFAALVFAVIVGLGQADATNPRSSILTFLIVAPLVPVLGVALAYGPRADPAHDITLSTPMSGLRLVLTRSLVVLVVSATLLGLAALGGPSIAMMATAWLLPALGLVSLNIALMTVLAPHRAALATASSWLALLLGLNVGSSDPLAAFSGPAQVSAGVLAVGCLAVANQRRQALDHAESGL